MIREALAVLPGADRHLEKSLEIYLEALIEANRTVSLVSRQDTARHVARFTRECLFLAERLRRELPSRGEARLLDLGSGGGFPGLILKLALPDVQTTLVEATQKKTRFLAGVCEKLDLRGISVIWARAEALADRKSSGYRPDFRHTFDWVTAKALGPLRASLDLAAPFLKDGGVHWTFKGAGYAEEIASCRRRLVQLGCHVLGAEPIPGDERSFIVAVQRRTSPSVSRETQ